MTFTLCYIVLKDTFAITITDCTGGIFRTSLGAGASSEILVAFAHSSVAMGSALAMTAANAAIVCCGANLGTGPADKSILALAFRLVTTFREQTHATLRANLSRNRCWARDRTALTHPALLAHTLHSTALWHTLSFAEANLGLACLCILGEWT